MFVWRGALRVFIAWLFSAQLSAATETYNFLQWNRANYERGSSEHDKREWYEWWYYKVNLPGTDRAFYFIYGVVNPWDQRQTKTASRSYVSFGSFPDLVHRENLYPVKDFKGDYQSARVKIANNFADGKSLVGKVFDDDGFEFASWNLKMDLNWSFNAMGWGLFVPSITNIFWFPAQASASMSGTIVYKGQTILLDHAPAYQDRNWGRSFPRWWTWIVANSFENSPSTSLAAGGGFPGILGHLYLLRGLAIGLRHEDKEYKFRTTDGDRVQFDIRFGKWEVEAENRRNQKIYISAYADREKFIPIPFHTPQGDDFIDYEALKADVKVRLFSRESRKKPWQLSADLLTREGGLEYGTH